MATKAIHSARIGPAQFEVDIDDYGVVLRRTDSDRNESARIGRPIVCYMEPSARNRNLEPGYYVCKSWMSEPSICLNDLSDDEIFEFSVEFGIPLDELDDTLRRTFFRSPAGVAFEAHVKGHPKKYISVAEIGGPAHRSNVDSTSRWFMRKSIDKAEFADEFDEEDADRLMPGF